MIKIIALSDTHLDRDLPKNLVDLARGADIIMHAGDFVNMEIYDTLNDLGRVEAVCGNADSPTIRRLLPERKVVDVEKVRIGLIHRASHSSEPLGAGMLAREIDVDVLVYGHLHRPYVERGNKLLICPGSPIVPRMSPPTVAEIEIDGSRVRGRIIPLGKPTCDYLQYAESLARKAQ
jgi:putative phosphoesterase